MSVNLPPPLRTRGWRRSACLRHALDFETGVAVKSERPEIAAESDCPAFVAGLTAPALTVMGVVRLRRNDRRREGVRIRWHGPERSYFRRGYWSVCGGPKFRDRRRRSRG